MYCFNFFNSCGEAVDTRLIYASSYPAACLIASDYCYEYGYSGYSLN